ncbi:putative bifunctional diguanylate cyclase/phosphodiesterase [Paraburkholderia caribensis]|uniref:putative bifunctional diguanylate cyclase/phosphodiesterase n=1 Tax=Paraburkholderia caribensis TaxID=75105 RepID=UPI000720A674|nr:EAL domain-containing protein [Paraburkholderia caribensis]ALP68492.1 diguanylate cyclase [Paraburkholderia caribensis]AUT57846.1 bifunctional diguanylate cyclase/phosphodiesterase [Paraburkholderia caribensis]
MTDTPESVRSVKELRRLSAKWPEQLDAAARSVALAGETSAIDASLLQRANETFSSIMSILTTLRTRERDEIAQMQFNSQSELAGQKIFLSVLEASGALLLVLLLYTSHRAALARARAKVVASEAERRFEEYFENHPVAMLIYDVDTYLILTANAAAQRQYGASLQQLREMRMDQLRPAEEAEPFRRDLKQYVESGVQGGSGGLRRHRRADGTTIFVDIAFHLLDYAERKACFISARDVTDYECAKEALRVRSSALEASRNAVLISEKSAGTNIITYANAAFESITGFPVREVIGLEQWSVLGCEVTSRQARSVQLAMHSDAAESALLECRRRDGTPYWSQLQVAPVLGESGRPTHCVTVFNDVSERIRDQEQLRAQAHQDPLTQLPNRLGLNARLNPLLSRARRDNERIALVFLDLDNFKVVNDSLGHTAGDALLHEVARRLSSCTGPQEFAVRYAGDEFVVVLYGRGDIDEFVAAAQEMQAGLSQDARIENSVVSPQASIGIAVYPDHAQDLETLLRCADSAMYRAKFVGPSGLQIYDEAIARENSERVAVAHDLRNALASGALSLAYQPRLSLETGLANGFEALVRWNDPVRGSVSPAMFVPIAEENGLITEIGEWVLEQACRQTKIWALQHPDIVVSVNVSPVQFLRSDLLSVVTEVIQRTGVNPRNIEIEITEGVLMAVQSVATLRGFRKIGLSVAIDDFGSGYSSLGYVRSFMADRLKLDMSFVKGIGLSTADEVIVKAVIAMGRTLGMQVVAEGVETHRQLEFLIENGCEEIQGYWYARPTDAARATAFLDNPRKIARVSDGKDRCVPRRESG